MPNRNDLIDRWITHFRLTVITCCLCLLPSLGLATPSPPSRWESLPSATLRGADNPPVAVGQLKGTIKILSLMRHLNTPVCDEQTTRFSENTGGLKWKLRP